MSDIRLMRINIKPSCSDEERKNLIDDCLQSNPERQYVAIGWSYVYTDDGKLITPKSFNSYEDFYNEAVKCIKERKRKVNHALNSFWYVKEGDLFWTRDLNGFYWICRAKGKAEPRYIYKWDVGAIVPVNAYRVGLEVPGQIKASFNRPHGGVIDDSFEEIMINYSKYIYNQYEDDDKKRYANIVNQEGSIIRNLPDKDLEELVISYLQIKQNYYLLSNSIASGSTTVSIECEFLSRDKDCPKKAVVQVKAIPKIKPYEYQDLLEKGYEVYFYDGGRVENIPGYKYISEEELLDFFEEYKAILPESITKWEVLFASNSTKIVPK